MTADWMKWSTAIWITVMPPAIHCGGSSEGPFGDASPHPLLDGGSGSGSVDGAVDANLASDDSGNIDQESLVGEGGLALCRTDSDCIQPSQQFCVPCFEGGVSCASTQCVNGNCTGFAANWGCSGPVTDPCAEKSCGDSCQQCSTPDGGCYSGVCTWFNLCKADTVPVCTVTATRGCAPTDATGLGDCNDFLGWAWDGSKCVALAGCLCQGSDCSDLLGGSLGDCDSVYSDCRGNGG
jgi:hypothetical protein